jgi:hypothetical protein
MFLLGEDREVLGGVSRSDLAYNRTDSIQPTTNWYHELDLPGAFNAGMMKSIMMSLPSFFSRVPDQSIIASPIMEAESEAERGDEMVSGMKGDGWCAVHLPKGGRVSVNLHKSLPLGQAYRSWWIDPKTGGRAIDQSGKCVALDPAEFVSPKSNGAQNDWLLLIEHAWSGANAMS